MRIYCLIIFLLLAGIAFSCTIGVASGEVTASGRPLVWKTRDIGSFPINYLEWETDADIDFLYLRDVRDSLAWMGLNENGFAIVNSYVQREVNRPIFNNGSLIFHLLGNCSTIFEMDALLDTLDISQQVLSGNFAVLDSTGAAAMYEISWTEVQKYDAALEEDGFIIRTNFSLISGGADGIERYQRSKDIIEDLVTAGELNPAALIQNHMRDFSDDSSQPVSVPYHGRWLADRPWGYIKSNVSIARGIAASSIIMEGVLPAENASTTTMLVSLGHPAVSAFFPCWPIAPPPLPAAGSDAPLAMAAAALKAQVFDYNLNSYYLDSFNLIEEGQQRVWDVLLPQDAQMLQEVNDFLPQWRNGTYTNEDALILSEEWADRVNAAIDSAAVNVTHQLTADFTIANASGGYPLTVQFQDRSRHQPQNIYWDFNNDDFYDNMGSSEPEWTYESPGTYSPLLHVINDSSSDEIILQDAVTVNETSAHQNEISAEPLLLGNYPNPFFPELNRDSGTNICFYLPHSATEVNLEIYNQKGQVILQTVLSDSLPAGRNTWNWNGENQQGKAVSSGIYFYRLKSSTIESDIAKITLIR